MLPGSLAAEIDVIVNACPNLAPPFVDRVYPSAVSDALSIGTTTLPFGSYPTAGSLTGAYVPAGVVTPVIPGRLPLVHVVPLFVDVAKPMSDEPPLKKRPNCAVATIVLPDEYVSGSTIVLCSLVALVKGSVAICVSATLAEATIVRTSAAVATKPNARGSRLRADEKTNRI